MRMMSKPVEKTFDIKDEVYGDWAITVAQATEAVNEALADAPVRVVYNEQGGFKGTERDQNARKRARILAYHTLVSMIGFTNDDGVEQFPSKTENNLLRVKHAMSEPEFIGKWHLLPSSVVDRIVEMVREVNPNFDPNG